MTGRGPAVAVFVMSEPGHLRRLLPIVAGLAAAGAAVGVWTRAANREAVHAAGATCFDLFAAHSVEDADATSVPQPCRSVSFAGHYGHEVVDEVAAFGPDLVVYDTFAVVGRVVATALDVPAVNVCAGHAVVPERFLGVLADDPRVAVAPACHEAVEILRRRWGMAGASPFSYVDGRSPWLNLYCEPAAYLAPADQAALAPLAFVGSLPEVPPAHADPGGPAPFTRAGTSKVYVSLGTIASRYYADEVEAALVALADALDRRPDTQAVVSLAGLDVDPSVRARLERPSVEVVAYADQWRVLAAADAFVTHQGLNSTHEAVRWQVPMISYPFFWDQPALSATCQRLGLAVPLTDHLRAPVTAEAAGVALDAALTPDPVRDAALARAWRWEQEVMAGRPAVLRQVLDLA